MRTLKVPSSVFMAISALHCSSRASGATISVARHLGSSDGFAQITPMVCTVLPVIILRRWLPMSVLTNLSPLHLLVYRHERAERLLLHAVSSNSLSINVSWKVPKERSYIPPRT
jgi:hypothetical protein